MAFTIEEIERALTTSRPEWPKYYPQNADRQKSANYPIIINYLSGKSTVLTGLIQDEEIFFWNTLVNLLPDLENISAARQLVLDVIYEPVVFRNIQGSFNHWLLTYAVNHKTDAAFAAVKKQLQQQGMNDDAIFNYCITGMSYGADSEFDFQSVGLFKFLSNYIKSQPALPALTQGYAYWSDDWNFFYFKLLEAAKPAFADEYVVSSIQSRRHNLAAFFHTYRDGKYLQPIISNLTNRQNHHSQMIESKFSFALQLFETNQDQYKALAIEISNQYLAHVAIHTPKKTWEPNFNLKELEATVLSYLPYTAVAFHLLLQYEKEHALQLLDEWTGQKVFIQFGTLQVLERHLKEAAFPFLEAVFKTDALSSGIDYTRKLIDLLQQKFQPAKYLPLLWGLSNSKSKPIRELIAKVLAEKDADAEEKAIALLQHKNGESRQTAAIILGYFTNASAKEAVMKVLNTEANDNARDILLQTVADNLPTEASVGFIDDMVQAAKSRGKLSKPLEAWLDETTLPSLFYTTGKELSIDEKRFLLYRMSRIKEMRSDMEAKYILQFTDRTRSNDFAMHIIKLYIEKDAKPEHKYLLALAALLGNDAVVDKICITINKWMEENRYKMAEHGVGALALQGSDKALRWVEWYSRKYKSKKANVGAAALIALETAAQELGITIQELGDRVVPDFGFDGLFRNFTAGNEEYRAFIDSNFKIAFFNEDNKKLKVIPAAADATLKEEFKAIAKEVRDIVKSQSSRLEYYLIIQRRWSYEQWKKFFLQNPVMFIYATKFLWGTYDEAGQLVQTFICSEDTSLLNIENEETELDDNAMIGMVHPSQLNAAALQQWKQQFFDLKIDPVFPQLNRLMPALEDLDLSKTILTKFAGKRMKEGSIRSTLEKFGWHKGPTGDGGMVESFNLLYSEKKIEAVLEAEGVGAGYGWGMEEKLGRLYIVDKTKLAQRWFHPKDEKDENLVALKNVPTIFLCEALAAVASIKPFETALPQQAGSYGQ